MSNNLDMSPASSKIALSVLTIEITRRCNIRPICPHCLRGDPQNIDLSTHVIDNLLEQTHEIGNLCITGGEPLVSLPSLEYLFQKIKLNRVKLSYFSLITNGLIAFCGAQWPPVRYRVATWRRSGRLHSAAPNGSWCGGQRQSSAANGSGILGCR